MPKRTHMALDLPLPPCGGGLGWGDHFEGGSNRFDHAIDALQNIVIPDAQNPIPLRLQPRCARFICFGPLSMLPAIDFDDEPCFQADKIGNVRTKGYLPSEAVAVDLFAAQSRPEPSFGVRWIAAQLSSYTDRHDSNLADATPLPNPPPQGGREYFDKANGEPHA
jgi:hypothetical protein